MIQDANTGGVPRAAAAAEQLEFLARAGQVLAHSLDYETTLRRVAHLSVPQIADWCAIDLVGEDGAPQRVAVTHVDPDRVALAYELARRYPPDPDAGSGIYAVLRSGDSLLYPEINDEMLVGAAQDETHLELLRRLELRSSLVVPLKAHGRILGTITLVAAESGRRYGEEDLTLANELARRAALAVDNARLYREATTLNRELEERVAQRTQELEEANRQLIAQMKQHREAEARFRALLESAPDAMIIVDEAGHITLVNSQAEVLFGYERHDLLQQPVEILVPPPLHQRHSGHRAAYGQEPRARSMGAGLSLHGQRRDGSEFPVEISLSPLATEGGMLVIAAVRDVSEQREAQARLQRSEALHRALADNIPSGSVLLVDRDFRYLLARGPALQRTGLDYLEGRRIGEGLSPELAEKRMANYRAAFAGERTTEEMEYEGRTYQLQTVPLADAEGEIYAALVLSQDITELKEAETTARTLLRLSGKLHAMLDPEALLDILVEEAMALTQATAGFAGYHTNQRLLTQRYFQGEEVLPIHEEWPPGRGLPGFVLQSGAPYLLHDAAHDEHASAGFYNSFGVHNALSVPVQELGGTPLAFVEVHNKKGGQPFTAADREKLVGLAQIAAIAIQNARSFARLRTLGRRLVSAQEEERRRLARELHDSAGQVLTALSIHLTMLNNQVDGALQEGLEQAVEQVTVLHDELRAAAHALRPPTLDLNGFNESLRILCRDFANTTGLAINYRGEEVGELPDEVSLNLYRLLQEALNNVAKHAHAGRVEVALAHSNGSLQLSISDDGIGLAPDDALRHRAGGTGLLGMRERLELIGGSMSVTSQPKQGTHITARCPL